MGKLRVYCLKTLNKLSNYPLDTTPSAPSVWKRASSQEIWCPMECSKTRLLTRDMARVKEVGVKVASELLSQTTPIPFSFIKSRGSDDRHTSMSANPHNPVYDHDTSRHNNAPMIHVPLLSPMNSVFHISHLYAFPSSSSAYMAHRSSPCDFGLS